MQCQFSEIFWQNTGYTVLTKCFQAGSLVTVKAPPPFCSVIPPLPSSASHCSFLRWENSSWNIHGGFELGNCSGKAVISKTRRRIFSYVFPHIVQVCARSNGLRHDQRCIVVNYPNSSGVEWHSTQQKCARRRRCGHAELPKYSVYPRIATLFTLKPMSCCYKQYLVTFRSWKCCYYILCEKELLWKRWNGKVYGGFIVGSRFIAVYIELKKASEWYISLKLNLNIS